MTAAPLAQSPDQPIVITRDEVLLGDIAAAREEAENLPPFEYNTKQGSKDARSYIYKLRLLKGRIEAARKEGKEWSLVYGREVDNQARILTREVDDLIAPHQSQLDAIAVAEQQRVAHHRAALNRVIDLGRPRFGATASEIRLRIENLDGIKPDGLEEFASEAEAAIRASREALTAALERAQETERKQEELAALQAQLEQQNKELEALRPKAAEQGAGTPSPALPTSEHPLAPAPSAIEHPLAPASPTPPTADPPRPTPRTSLRDLLVAELLLAMEGKTKKEVADRIADDSLHYAVRVIRRDLE